MTANSSAEREAACTTCDGYGYLLDNLRRGFGGLIDGDQVPCPDCTPAADLPLAVAWSDYDNEQGEREAVEAAVLARARVKVE